MKHKKQIEMFNKIKQEKEQQNKILEMLDSQRLIIMLMLADKFNFRKKRLEKFIEELFKICGCYINEKDSGQSVTCNEIKNVLKDEYDFNYDEFLLKCGGLIK